MGWIIWDKGQRDFSLADGEMAWTSFDKAMRIFTYARAKALQEGKIHPTQKPVKLYEWILDKYASDGAKILDTHLGSGSIAVACWNMKFDLTAYEIDKEYYDKACKRFDLHSLQMTLW
jgi:site-specific DNA-methyltransferase (adenine-specific)